METIMKVCGGKIVNGFCEKCYHEGTTSYGICGRWYEEQITKPEEPKLYTQSELDKFAVGFGRFLKFGRPGDYDKTTEQFLTEYKEYLKQQAK